MAEDYAVMATARESLWGALERRNYIRVQSCGSMAGEAIKHVFVAEIYSPHERMSTSGQKLPNTTRKRGNFDGLHASLRPSWELET